MGLLNRINRRTKLQGQIAHHEWEAAKKQLKNHPNEVRQWIDMKFHDDEITHALPLHQAAQTYAPIDLIAALIEAYPKALRKGDSRQNGLPLHYAYAQGPYP